MPFNRNAPTKRLISTVCAWSAPKDPQGVKWIMDCSRSSALRTQKVISDWRRTGPTSYLSKLLSLFEEGPHIISGWLFFYSLWAWNFIPILIKFHWASGLTGEICIYQLSSSLVLGRAHDLMRRWIGLQNLEAFQRNNRNIPKLKVINKIKFAEYTIV